MKVVNSVPPLRRPRRASERLSILDSDRHIIPPIVVGSTELASRTSTLFPRGSHSNLLSVPLWRLCKENGGSTPSAWWKAKARRAYSAGWCCICLNSL